LVDPPDVSMSDLAAVCRIWSADDFPLSIRVDEAADLELSMDKTPIAADAFGSFVFSGFGLATDLTPSTSPHAAASSRLAF